jgi:hypothetical protein
MGGISINQKYNRFDDPNVCPHCHLVIEPKVQKVFLSVNDEKENELITVWQCSNQKCQRLFVAEYQRRDSSSFKFERYLNGLPKGPEWPKPILELKSSKLGKDSKTVKSNFIKTYLQSLEAENYGLNELSGMGYRKAIEYLVKDWAIQNNPDKKKEILNSWLGKVIKEYYEGDLKEILERATWLGNDQAHYNRLFEEFDVDVLKELIDLIMVELDRQYKKAHYIEIIKSKK